MSITRTILRPQILRLRNTVPTQLRFQSTGGIPEISTLKEFLQRIDTPKLTVTDFHAQWCGPCKAIAPVIEKFSENYTNVQFLKVDVDEAGDIAQEYGITAMPTFVLYKDGEPLGKIVGAAPDNVKKAIEKYM